MVVIHWKPLKASTGTRSLTLQQRGLTIVTQWIAEDSWSASRARLKDGEIVLSLDANTDDHPDSRFQFALPSNSALRKIQPTSVP